MLSTMATALFAAPSRSCVATQSLGDDGGIVRIGR